MPEIRGVQDGVMDWIQKVGALLGLD